MELSLVMIEKPACDAAYVLPASPVRKRNIPARSGYGRCPGLLLVRNVDGEPTQTRLCNRPGGQG